MDQPLLRTPYELSRRNFKNAQRVIEHTTSALTTSLTATTKAASKPSTSPNTTLESVDSMLTRLQTLKRKLQVLHEEETKIHTSAKARLQHLQDLYDVQSLVDVKYDEWSRTRLSRLLVDYLLREGYTESAACLARSKGIEELVDVDAFVACQRIERSLREGMSTGLALEWCKEHGKELKKVGSKLEFELRFQQFIELTLYSPTRWSHLADLFLQTHHTLYSLPPRPLLHIALSAGLSALKTPACHSAYTPSSASPDSAATTTVCPICSTELNELARNVPYALHTKSIVEDAPVVLPNGRIYGEERLRVFNEKVGTERGW
ncbi:CTLH multi-domain protein [Pyrenophora tritici-repentis]|nr:CTLH multi-domain protein [Pyrenophora tritici-repentis]